MTVLPDRVKRRREIHDLYKRELGIVPGITVQDNPSSEYDSNFWLTTILIDPASGSTPDELRMCLNRENIESRLLWRPMHLQPVFADAPYYGTGVSDYLFERGLCLPSGSSLTDEQIKRVISIIKAQIK